MGGNGDIPSDKALFLVVSVIPEKEQIDVERTPGLVWPVILTSLRILECFPAIPAVEASSATQIAFHEIGSQSLGSPNSIC